jgi:putative methionine-R-sulfoxide reductase with GAF domain
MVDDLLERWDLPSVYLLVEGRLRCQASRGYFQVSDGFTTSTGVIGRVISSNQAEVVADVRQDPAFIAAIPGLRSEVCVPVTVDGVVVGAVNLESRSMLSDAAVEDAHAAAAFLAGRIRSSVESRSRRWPSGWRGSRSASRARPTSTRSCAAPSRARETCPG